MYYNGLIISEDDLGIQESLMALGSQGLSDAQVGRLLGVGKSTVYGWRHGQTPKQPIPTGLMLKGLVVTLEGIVDDTLSAEGSSVFGRSGSEHVHVPGVERDFAAADTLF